MSEFTKWTRIGYWPWSAGRCTNQHARATWLVSGQTIGEFAPWPKSRRKCPLFPINTSHLYPKRHFIASSYCNAIFLLGPSTLRGEHWCSKSIWSSCSCWSKRSRTLGWEITSTNWSLEMEWKLLFAGINAWGLTDGEWELWMSRARSLALYKAFLNASGSTFSIKQWIKLKSSPNEAIQRG